MARIMRSTAAGTLALGALLTFGSGTATADSARDSGPIRSKPFVATAEKTEADGKTVRTNFMCVFGYEYSGTAEDPSEVTYKADVWCDPFTSPKIAGTIRAVLYDDENEIVDEQPVTPVNPVDPTPSVSQGTKAVQRPATLYVQNNTEVTILEPNTVWIALPEGCTGGGTPIALCYIDGEKFYI